MALASLGADSIRSFDEENKRSRMCEVFYDYTRDYLLAKFDWTFSRALAKLNEVTVTTPVPDGTYVYQLPANCKTPRDLHPLGSRENWRIMADKLYCQIPPEVGVYLYYTFLQEDVSKYSDVFSNLLSLGLSARLCPAITQDKKLSNTLYSMYKGEILEVMEVDGNIGTDHPGNDDNPDLDTFVNPDSSPIITGFENA